MEFPTGNNAGGKRVRGAEVLAPRRRGRRHEFDDPEDDEDEDEGDDAPRVHDPLMPVRRGQQSATEAALADALRAEARAKAARQQHKEAETKEAKKSDKSKKVSFAAEEGEDTVCAAETVRSNTVFVCLDLPPDSLVSHRKRPRRQLLQEPCVGRVLKASQVSDLTCVFL